MPNKNTEMRVLTAKEIDCVAGGQLFNLALTLNLNTATAAQTNLAVLSSGVWQTNSQYSIG